MKLARKIAAQIRRHVLRARLGSEDFTVISNNCWGAHIYQQLKRPYQTPFVGVYLAPACYVTFVVRYRWFLAQPLRFTSSSRHEYINAIRDDRKLNYPIGCLGSDVEIQFLHYDSEKEAADKWCRRLQRVNHDDSRIYFKFCDRDGCTEDQLMAFDNAEVRNKVCFVSRPTSNLLHSVWIPESESGQVPDGLQLSRISPKYFDAAGWINGTGQLPRWLKFLRTV